MKICIIISDFYPEISKLLLEGTLKKLKKYNLKKYRIFKVPGSFEIPTVVSALINKYDGFIVLGCIIKGKTPHFNFICTAVFDSLSRLSVKYKKPLGNGILTCNNKKQAIERANPQKKNKGGSAVEAMISVLKTIQDA
tara:strand:- start:552 stop:965 length:414 start_codon:yes stop_codon:yes gene_type:complete